MITLTPTAAAILGIVAGAWLVLALAATLRGRGAAAREAAARRDAARLSALVASGPGAPLLVARDGSLEGGERLAGWLGLDRLPRHLATLLGTGGPFGTDGAALLDARVQEAMKAGGSGTLVLQPAGTRRILRLEVAPAPPALGAGGAVIWATDVTDTERQLRELADSRGDVAGALEALTALIEAAPFPIWHRGADLKLALVNGAYVAAVEADSAATVIAEQLELVDESEGHHAAEEAAEVRARGTPSHRTVPATVAGERRMMQIVEVPVGESGVAGFAVDVEEEERARAELTRFQRAQRDMLDRLSAGVAQFGRDRSLMFFNQPFARLFGLTAEVLAERPEFDRVIDAMRDARKLPEPRDFPGWRAERRAWFTAGLTAIEEDWELPDRRHLRVLAQPLPDGGLLVIFEDRTRQVMLETDRERMLQVQTTTFDNLAEGIAVFASSRRLKLWNDRFRALWQLDAAKLEERPMLETLSGELGRLARRPRQALVIRDLIRAAIVTRRPRAVRLSLKDGRELELAAIPIPVDDVLFTTLDVTDSARVETALRERTAALEEADRVKTAFMSSISYELRTPLTSIGGFAEMLAGGYAGELPDTARDYVAAILSSVARLSALIDDVLDLTQSDTGGLLLAEEEVDICSLVEDAAEAARAEATGKGLRFAAECLATAGVVTGDRRRLAQAVQNLLRNAVQYTPAGGSVWVTAEGDEAEARIIVADDGPGIAPADQARIFDRFQRSAQTGGGAGIGLPLARQFVEAHGGAIRLDSAPGEGSRFTVTLPRTAEQRAAYRGLLARAGSGDGAAAEA